MTLEKKQNLNIVVFNGGRGASSMLKFLDSINNIKIHSLVNAYDDGKSTGEIRDFFNILGPSDIRKTQSSLINIKNKNYKKKIFFFNFRFDQDCTRNKAFNLLTNLTSNNVDRKFYIDQKVNF